MKSERQPQTSRPQIRDGEPNAGQCSVHEGETGNCIWIIEMDCGEGNRGEKHTKPREARACQRLQGIAAEECLFGCCSEYEQEGRHCQGLADWARARWVDSEM